ncbi:MAG TPA: type II toxin-antitoxin system HicB family antitoxin [Deltaproteobacteria bacterium]|nr:MAG: HicB family protein [Deltaproteobacteria bacterium]RLB92146.1 MAG: type II toxin-antitoxin system HicB family antitoxin [Deltaproteobacteria bacterium]HDM75260.1 type II toxin-antitoxin system HicB family antitoxin [Deltaproteobacteria bacterium]
MYVSYRPELDIASCGEDVHQAKKNLIEAILINIEECGLEEINTDILSVRKELVGFTLIEVAV